MLAKNSKMFQSWYLEEEAHLSSSCRCFSSCSFWMRARRRRSASSLDASSASVVPPTLRPVGVLGDSVEEEEEVMKDKLCVCKLNPDVTSLCLCFYLSPNNNISSVFTCVQLSAGGFRDLFALWRLWFGGLPVQGAVTFDLSESPVVGAGGGGSLSERGGRVLSGGAGGLGAAPVGLHPETEERNWWGHLGEEAGEGAWSGADEPFGRDVAFAVGFEGRATDRRVRRLPLRVRKIQTLVFIFKQKNFISKSKVTTIRATAKTS